MSVKQGQVEIYIKEDMDITKRSWLIATFLYKEGIISAWFEREDHHQLVIRFEQDKFSNNTLLDVVRMHGYQGEILQP